MRSVSCVVSDHFIEPQVQEISVALHYDGSQNHIVVWGRKTKEIYEIILLF